MIPAITYQKNYLSNKIKYGFLLKKSLDSILIIKHRKLLIAMLCNDK